MVREWRKLKRNTPFFHSHYHIKHRNDVMKGKKIYAKGQKKHQWENYFLWDGEDQILATKSTRSESEEQDMGLMLMLQMGLRSFFNMRAKGELGTMETFFSSIAKFLDIGISIEDLSVEAAREEQRNEGLWIVMSERKWLGKRWDCFGLNFCGLLFGQKGWGNLTCHP